MSASFDPKHIKFSTAGGGGSSLLTGLLSYWKMDEGSGSAIDAVGDNDGVETGTPTHNGAGIKVGYTFDGTEYLSCGDTLKPTQITMSAWIQCNPSGSEYYAIMGHFLYSSPFGITMNTEGTRVRVLVADPTGINSAQATSSTIIASATVWHMVTATVDGSTLKLYIDGGLETLLEGGTSAAFPYAVGYTTGATEWKIGYRVADDLYMIGSIDEVGVWNRALTGVEVQDLYNSGSGRTHPFS